MGLVIGGVLYKSVGMKLLLLFSLLLTGLNSHGFEGEIIFSREVSGVRPADSSEGGAREVRIYLRPTSYRQEELNGRAPGRLILNKGAQQGLWLNPLLGTSILGGLYDYDLQGEKAKEVSPYDYQTDLKNTGERATIEGYRTKKYLVTKSNFLKDGAKLEIWVAADLELGNHRYAFGAPGYEIQVPMPLLLPLDQGSVLKSVLTQGDYQVTTTCVRVRPVVLQDNLFVKHRNFAGPSVPLAPDVMQGPARPVREAVDVETLDKQLLVEGMSLLLVKPGSFWMGSKERQTYREGDERRHRVQLDHAYYLGMCEVTQGQWRAVMGEDFPSKFQGSEGVERADLPVDGVTWVEAQEFCRKLSEISGREFRLPTEAEWEYAAKADWKDWADGAGPEYLEYLNASAWHGDTANYQTHAVGQLQPNQWGFRDMLGNLSEWTYSGYGKYPISKNPLLDPQGAVSEVKVVRGGSWVESPLTMRISNRTKMQQSEKRSTIGFRVAAEVLPRR